MNALIAILVPSIFFALVGISVLYIDARLRAIFPWPRRWFSRPLLGALAFGALLAISLGATAADPAAGVGYLVGGYVFTLQLYLVLTLLGLQVVQGLRPVGPAAARWLAIGVPVLLTSWGSWQARSFEVTEATIEIPKLAKPVSVMLITDVHLGHHRGAEYLAKIVERTNQQHPDIVLIAGDLVDSNFALRPAVFEPLRGFVAPVFYVEGNHEKAIDERKALALVESQGVRVLHNDVVHTEGLQLVGLDYMKADDQSVDLHPSKDPHTIASVLPTLGLDASQATILMHHSPAGARYAEAAGVDLMVAGHTHGGQLFPGTWINSAFFEFNRGHYRAGRLQVFVSQGAGTFLQPIRLGSQNEVNLLRLVPPSNQR